MKRFGLLGHNIAYSLSPKIHSEYYAAHGINASYELVDTDNIASVADRLRKDFDGFNITKPYKQDIVPYLDELMTDAGAVNTVSRHNGRLIGYNTDGTGFLGHIRELGVTLRGKDVLVLGAGGVATVIVPVLIQEGATVSIHNRTIESALALTDKCGGAVVKDISKERPQIIINCTSVGLGGENCLPAGLSLDRLEFGYDTIYSPPKTPFLEEAERVGARITNGYRMLELQAYEAIRIWTDL